MTNQTIDGVLVSSSDLKEIYDHMVGVWQMIDKDHGECGVTLEQLMDRGGHPVIAKVRALLAKSRTTYVIGTSHKCDKRVPYGRGVTIPCGTSVDGVVRYHDSCRVTREVEDVVVAAPAAEPVAVFEIDTTGYRCRVTLDPSKGLPPNGTNLYAEPQKHGEPVRPAPVVLCSFCDATDQAGNPWTGHHESVDGELVYRVMGCKDHKNLVDALIGVDPAPVEWVPTVAQIRYRRPERNYPDFGIWHEFPLKHYDKNRTWFIDNNGWECETRLLFIPVVKP